MQTDVSQRIILANLKKVMLYLVLALPLVLISIMLINEPRNKETYDMLMHVSGEFTVRFLVIVLLISPLRIVFPRNSFLLWMLKQRRNIGVASFIYALIHTLIYLIYHADISKYWLDLGEFTYMTGWIAMLIYLPLGITSNNYFVKKLGFPRWKKLQNWTYVTAVCVVIHWLLKPDGGTIGPVLLHFTPLLLLQVWRMYSKKKFKRAM